MLPMGTECSAGIEQFERLAPTMAALDSSE
jgi:hypothetical protein